MIENIGVDIIENIRFESFLNNQKKLERILSSKEIDVLNTYTAVSRQLEYIASRFAAKEALYKTGLKFTFNKISILNREDGRPYVEGDFNKKVLISISHNKTMSIATVLLVEPCFEYK
jgi:holo-[acyl-carrier protein] synthase